MSSVFSKFFKIFFARAASRRGRVGWRVYASDISLPRDCRGRSAPSQWQYYIGVRKVLNGCIVILTPQTRQNNCHSERRRSLGAWESRGNEMPPVCTRQPNSTSNRTQSFYSDRSDNSGFIEFINANFLLLDHDFICFSREIASFTSLHDST